MGGTTMKDDKDVQAKLLEEQQAAAAQKADNKKTAKAMRKTEVPVKDEPAEPLAMLQKKISNLGGFFQGGRFEFVGTLLKGLGDFLVNLMPVFQSIIPQIKKIGEMFNNTPEKPKKLKEPEQGEKIFEIDEVKNLVKKGELQEAQKILITEEKNLLEEMNHLLKEKHSDEFQQYKKDFEKLEEDLAGIHFVNQEAPEKEPVQAVLQEKLKKIQEEFNKVTTHYAVNNPPKGEHSFRAILKRSQPIIEAHQLLFKEENSKKARMSP